MRHVFEEARLGDLRLKNRLIRSATWEGIAAPDGGISETAYEIYEELARGGVGAIITGFTSVAANDYYFDGMMRLCDDTLIPQYRKLTDLIHAQNCPVIAQLALGAYYRALPNGSYRQVEPDDMTEEKIKAVIAQFGEAARRAKEAGYDGVQIHAAHFFFLSRFISPRVNHRTDAWGDSTEKRSRILTEILSAIREKAPGLHVTVKINSSDFTFGGLDEDESLVICGLLSDAGIDSIEVSGNGTSVGGIRAHVNEGYFVPAAARIAEHAACPVIVVGGFRSLDTMEAVLNKSEIAFLSLSRPLLREPELPRLLQADPTHISKCVSCNACYSSPCHKCVFRERERRGK